MSYFSPLCQLQLSIPQNRHVLLVPCFVRVHHYFVLMCDLPFEIRAVGELKCWQNSQNWRGSCTKMIANWRKYFFLHIFTKSVKPILQSAGKILWQMALVGTLLIGPTSSKYFLYKMTNVSPFFFQIQF